MLQVYLPVAEVSVNLLVMFGLGAAVGFLSGMFGVGGGFLMTPLLIFIGIPPAVAVGSEANQIVATSITGVIAQCARDGTEFPQARCEINQPCSRWQPDWLERHHFHVALTTGNREVRTRNQSREIEPPL